MPWFPDFAAAAAMARREYRADGRADPVGRYLTALNERDVHALEDTWPARVVVHDPRAGEVRGHKQLREFVRHSRSLLAERDARVEIASSTVVAGRAVVELVAHLSGDVAWPVAVVAESPDEFSVVFRTYLSLRVLDGRAHVREPVLGLGTTHPGDVVGRLQAALATGDVDAAVGAFGADGYLREPGDVRYQHRGPDQLRSYYTEALDDGGIALQHCAVTDDGVRCALEYNCTRWGGYELTPQAGIAVYERGGDGLLAAVRLYDDVEPRA
jgi:hypothetical protein